MLQTMHDFDRFRELLPFTIALYLAISVAQLQAPPPASRYARSTISFEDVVAGLKHHLIEFGKYEQNAMMDGFYGD